MNNKALLLYVGTAIFFAGQSTVQAAEIYNNGNNKLDFYGKINAGTLSSDKRFARIGLKGETIINDLLTGYGHWSYQLDTSNPEGSQKGGKSRLAFAGIKLDDIASLDYGRNYGVIYNVGAWTDVLPEFGGDSYRNTDLYMTDRANNLLTYSTGNGWGAVDDLAVSVQYQGRNEGTSRSVENANGEGFGVSATYKLTGSGISVGAAYANSEQAKNLGAKAEVWAMGAKYDANNVYLASMYAETRNMNTLPVQNKPNDFIIIDKTRNFEAVAQYMFDFGLRPSLSYVQSKGRFNNTTTDIKKYIAIGTYYNFNKNFVADVEYKVNFVKPNIYGIATDNQFGAGVTYKF